MMKFIRNIFDIRTGEGLKTFLMFAYIFLIIASLITLKPIRNSLFLVRFGISQLPYAYILVAVSALLFIKFYAAYANRIRLNLLILNTHLFFVLSLIIFWVLLRIEVAAGWFLYTFFVWVAVYGVVSASQFWLLANYVFDSRQAKRLFGFIGAGGISGGIFGGYFTNFLTPVVGTSNMLLFCLIFWGICIVILGKVWKVSARFSYRESIQQQRRISDKQFSSNPMQIILQSRHLSILAAIVGLSVLVSAVVDYQYAYIASSIIEKKDELTAFFGFWLSNLSLASLTVQFLLTGRVLKKFGVISSLFFLPFGIFIGAGAILIHPGLWSAVLIKVGEGSFKQSINKSGMELLYLPISSIEKNQAKAFIDVSVDSFATGLGGVFLILFANQLGFSIQHISLLLFILLGIWIYLLFRVRTEYINSFRQALEKRTIDIEDQNININDASIFQSLTGVLEGENERQILYALRLLENVDNAEFLPYLRKLITHPADEIRLQILRIIEKFKNVDLSENVKKLLTDPNDQVRVEAVRYLMRTNPNGIQFAHDLLNESDAQSMSSALLGLAYEYWEREDFRKEIDFKNLLDEFIIKSAESAASEDEKVFVKQNIARVIGIIRDPGLDPLLFNYLNDTSEAVKKVAVQSAGKTRNKIFIPTLISILQNKELRKYARDALAAYGEDIIENLEVQINDLGFQVRHRINLVKILSMIGCQKSVEVLLAALETDDMELKYGVLKALNKLRINFPMLSFDIGRIELHILKEGEYYHNLLKLDQSELSIINASEDGKTSTATDDELLRARKLLVRAIEEKLDAGLERIFRLLGLRYSPRDMYNAYLGVVSGRKKQQANAIEFLDNLLETQIKEFLIPVLEEYSLDAGPPRYRLYSDSIKISESDLIRRIFESGDSWLKVCGLYLASRVKENKPIQSIKDLTTDRDQQVREAALQALEYANN